MQTFTRGCLSVLVLVLAIDLLDGGDAEVGILAAAMGVGAVGGVVGIAVMKGQRGLATLLGIGVVLWAVPLAMMGGPRMVVVLVGMVVIGIGDALVDVGLFTLPARLVPDDVLARWFGALESVIAVSVAIGALVVTPLIAGLGARWTLVAVGLLGPACVLASWRGLCRIDAKVHVRDDAIDVLRRVAMLRPLPMPAIEALAARSERSTVPAGQAVFEQGDHGDRFYVIEAGTAVVQRDGREIATPWSGRRLRRDRIAARRGADGDGSGRHGPHPAVDRSTALPHDRQRLRLERGGGEPRRRRSPRPRRTDR